MSPCGDPDSLHPAELTVLIREKLLKYDARAREYDVTVLGEEAHLAYNRVGLTSFFSHRKIEDLYLNPSDWVRLIQQLIYPAN